MHNKKIDVRQLALLGVLTAMVFATSQISWQIGDIARLHMGNVMCLLGGIVFGPLIGGLSAGLGSMFYDMTNPLYISVMWITFINKFAMAFVAGIIARGGREKNPPLWRVITGAVSGQVVYIILFGLSTLLLQRFVHGNTWDGAWVKVVAQTTVSLANAVVAVAAVSMLAPPLRAALNKAGLFCIKPKAGKA